MLKNVLLPLFLILLTSAGTIYCWFEGLPLSLFGLIGLFTLGIGSMYIAYSVSNKVFPDKRNKPLPPIQDLLTEYQTQKGKPQAITKASVYGTIFAVALTAGGVYAWIRLADTYKEYELKNYGRETNAVIIDIGYQKGIGTYREYEYHDNAGKRFSDKFSNENLNIGDTVTILYSTNRPVINEVITPDDE